jgi:DNA-binding MarR family transcriptional regulator
MSDPRWLNGEEMRAWRALVATNSRLFARLDEELVQAHSISLAEYEVLVQLSEARGGALRMSDLAERALVSRSGLTRRLDGMVEAGLVCRQACPSDRRGTLAVLTERGREALEAAAPTHVAGVRRHLLDPLTPAQLEALGDALCTVLSRLEREHLEK